MKIYANNKKALYGYEVIEKYEAGIELYGFEVKSIRLGKVSLQGAFVSVKNGQAYILNMLVGPYQQKNTPSNYDEKRPRRLLLHKKEIQKLASKLSQKGLTAIPLSLYNKKRYVKVEIAVVRNKTKHDKREKLKEKDIKRQLRRSLKNSSY